MSAPKFTPGPWRTTTETIERGGEVDVYEIESPDAIPYWIALVQHQDHDAGLANAHLIAAAPEMYEALKASLAFLIIELRVAERSYLPDPTEDESELLANYEQAVDKCRAIIAKAEGAPR